MCQRVCARSRSRAHLHGYTMWYVDQCLEALRAECPPGKSNARRDLKCQRVCARSLSRLYITNRAECPPGKSSARRDLKCQRVCARSLSRVYMAHYFEALRAEYPPGKLRARRDLLTPSRAILQEPQLTSMGGHGQDTITTQSFELGYRSLRVPARCRFTQLIATGPPSQRVYARCRFLDFMS